MKIVNKTGLMKDTEILDDNGNKISGAYRVEFEDIEAVGGLLNACVYFHCSEIDLNVNSPLELRDVSEFGDSFRKYKKQEDFTPNFNNIVKRIERELEKPSCSVCRDLYAMKNQEPPCSVCLPAISDEELKIVEAYFYLLDQIDEKNHKVNKAVVLKYIELDPEIKYKAKAFRTLCDLLVYFTDKGKIRKKF